MKNIFYKNKIKKINKKSQFFIISAVFIALALTTIITYLSMPNELSFQSFNSEQSLMSRTQALGDSIISVMDNIYDSWWDPLLTQRIKIVLKEENNIEFNSFTQRIITNFPEDTDEESIRVIEDNKEIPFSLIWLDLRNKIAEISFQTSISRGGKKEIFVYFSKKTDSKHIESPSYDSKINVIENSTDIIINTNHYEAKLNKTRGGMLYYLSPKNYDNNLIINNEDYGVQSIFECNNTEYKQSSESNPTINIFNNGPVMVNIRVSGEHGIAPGREFYTQDYYFYPDTIRIKTNVRWAENINCEASEDNFIFDRISFNGSTLLGGQLYYKDNNTNLFENYDYVEDRPGDWIDYYHEKQGVGIILMNKTGYFSFYRNSTSSVKFSDLIGMNNTKFSPSSIEYEYVLYPHRGQWEKTRDYNILYNKSQIIENESFVDFFKSKENMIKNSFSQKGFSTYLSTSISEVEQSFNHDITWYKGDFTPNSRKVFKVYSKHQVQNFPIKISSNLPKGFDANSLLLSDKSGKKITTQIITDGIIANYSEFNVYCQNPDSIDYNNYTYYLFNHDGRNFTIGIDLEETSDFNVSIYYPNKSTIINKDNINTDKIYEIQSQNYKGFYKVVISKKNDNKYFRINSSLPYLILYNNRIRCKSGDSVKKIFFHVPENIKNIKINVSAYDSGARIKIKDLDGNILAENNTIYANTKYSFEIPIKEYAYGKTYYLEFETSGSVEIIFDDSMHSSKSTNKDYYIDYDKPKINLLFFDSLIGSKKYGIYYNVNTSEEEHEIMEPISFESDLVVNETKKIVNNSYFSWDLKNNVFTYRNSTNFFQTTDKWLTDFGNSSWIESAASTSLNNIEFIEKGPVRVRIKATSSTTPKVIYYFDIYAHQKFIKTTIIPETLSENDLTIGPFWNLNNTETRIYTNYDNGVETFSSENLTDKSFLAGKTFNWFGKRSNNILASIIAQSSSIYPSNKSFYANNNLLTIALPANQNNTIYFFIDDYSNTTQWDNVKYLRNVLISPPKTSTFLFKTMINGDSKNIKFKSEYY